jgi:hypothetical protein
MRLFLFVVGAALAIDGSLTVFSHKYLELMRHKFWYKTKMDAEMFPRANTVIFATNMLGV